MEISDVVFDTIQLALREGRFIEEIEEIGLELSTFIEECVSEIRNRQLASEIIKFAGVSENGDIILDDGIQSQKIGKVNLI